MANEMRKLMRGLAVDHPGDLNNHELVRLTRSAYPDEWFNYENERALSGALAMADGVLDGLGKSPVQRLPGMEDYSVPARITVPDGEGGIVHRRFEDCRIRGKDSDLRLHLRHVLQPHLDAVQGAVTEFRTNMLRIERSAAKLKVDTGEAWLQALEASS